MSAADDSLAAYPAQNQKQGWLGALWADKARLRRVLMIWGVGIFLAIAAIVYLDSGRYVTSDNSYVHANKLMVSTDVSGLVQTVNVHEGQQVKAGDILFTLDPKPFQIALENAQANLASTVQDVESTRAMYRAVGGQIAAQAAQLNVNKQTYARYQALAKQNAIAAMQVDTQHAAVLSAQATLVSLQQTAATQLAKLGGNPNQPAERTPDYLKAKAAVDEAQRQLDHAVVRAPFAGTVSEVDTLAARHSGGLGHVGLHHHQCGGPDRQSDLDFLRHEGNRSHPCPCRRAGGNDGRHLSRLPMEGPCRKRCAGSDSSFSALPAENASGNWVKVVQRIPVRVAIDHSACGHPLRAGMSTVITIDTGKRRITRLL